MEGNLLRYLELVNRRLFIVMHSGASWKPEYEAELANIDGELPILREMIETTHKKGAANYGN